MREDFPAIFEALTRRHNLTRREALAHIARLGGAAALAPVLKACGGGSGGGLIGEPVLDAADVPVDTFLYVMIENRSYDHYFGALTLEEGRAEAVGLSADMENKLPDGTPVRPYRLDDLCVYDPPHSWDESHAQFNDGALDRFVLEHYEDWKDSPYLDRIAPQVMGYHNRAQLPFYYGIADEFALGARYFCSLLGPTSPNRYYAHSASAAGMKANGDLDVILGGGVDVPTIYERLNAAGIPWKYYYYGLPFPFLYKPILAEALDVLGGMDVAKTRFIKNILPIDAYFADAAAGTLPNYCFIEPARGVADDHPPAHVQLGQAVIASLYQALAASPQWDR
ncbi:MAG: hypothetical protein K8I02_12835, partial [Candidatus Methylomirabilis sp.]|nr:hypothetical protein [Deltaproteobacteria bacterium]